MDLTFSSIAVVLFVVVYGALRWLGMSRDEQRRYIEELVRDAEQTMIGEHGSKKLDYVLDEAKRRFRWLPVDYLRVMIEAAVQRIKAGRLEPLEFTVDDQQ